MRVGNFYALWATLGYTDKSEKKISESHPRVWPFAAGEASLPFVGSFKIKTF